MQQLMNGAPRSPIFNQDYYLSCWLPLTVNVLVECKYLFLKDLSDNASGLFLNELSNDALQPKTNVYSNHLNPILMHASLRCHVLAHTYIQFRVACLYLGTPVPVVYSPVLLIPRPPLRPMPPSALSNKTTCHFINMLLTFTTLLNKMTAPMVPLTIHAVLFMMPGTMCTGFGCIVTALCGLGKDYHRRIDSATRLSFSTALLVEDNETPGTDLEVTFRIVVSKKVFGQELTENSR